MATINDMEVHSIMLRLNGDPTFLPFATIPTLDEASDVFDINETITGFQTTGQLFMYLQARYPHIGPLYLPPLYTFPNATDLTIDNTAGGVFKELRHTVLDEPIKQIINYAYPVDTSTYWLSSLQEFNSNSNVILQASMPIMNKSVIVNDKFLNGNNLSNHTYVVRFEVRRVSSNDTITYDLNIRAYGTVTIAKIRASRVWFLNMLANVEIDTYTPPQSPEDPYTGAGYNESTAPGGLSDGTFDFTDNGLTNVNTPGIDLLGSGFLTAWNVNKAQLNALANWLWVTTPSQIFQQIYGNPINAVIGLNVVPVAPSIDGGANTIKFGPEDSGVAAPKITSQYVSVNCGTLTIAPTYGSYMDYGPYSSAELFLPYCGGVPLDINDVVGKTIAVKYQVDILSGACVAYIFINGHLHYQKSGCCAGTAPVTGSQMPNVISGVLSIVGSVAGAIGSLGASGASTAAKVASGIATGTNVADAATNALKRSISYSGTVSGWAGLLGAQKPYLILTLPNAAIPAGQQQLSGYPAWVGGQLSGFSGHTECANVHLNGLRATDEEMQEIRALLESGVIL